MDAMENLGYRLSDQAVGSIPQHHGLPWVPERQRTTTRIDFINAHMSVLVGTDLFSVEVLTLCGLVTHYAILIFRGDSLRRGVLGSRIILIKSGRCGSQGMSL